MRVLNVAEKPSVAKAISEILTNTSANNIKRRNGSSKYNPIFEFNAVVRSQPCQMYFTSVSGHLMATDFADAYRNWNNVDPTTLFTCPIVRSVPTSNRAIATQLEQLARNSDWLILWLDCDREGENIAFEVLSVCTRVNQRLTIFRARFSALIPRDIQNALNNLVAPNAAFSAAVDCRQEIDLRIGSAFTRFQTMRLQRQFPGLSKSLISYGPCQFPTLGFVVERYWKRLKFVPEDFWAIQMSHTIAATTANFSWDRYRVFDRFSAIVLFELCVEAGSAKVIDVKSSEKTRPRPIPLSTVNMQKYLSTHARLSAQRSMSIAESLYQRGIISYPRTETTRYNSATDLMKFIEMQSQDQRWCQYATNLMNGGFTFPRDGGDDDHAHPPIHPTKYDSSLTGDDKRVYEFIVRHFLATCGRDAKGQQTIVQASMGSETFTANGLTIIEKNYLEVYTYEQWVPHSMPKYTVGQIFVPSELRLNNGRTQAPLLLTETALITLMDKNGIGTDATIAQHITTIQDRKYAVVQDRYFHPTPLGIGLIEAYKAMRLTLSTAALRAHMEQEIRGIAEGVKNKDEVLNRILTEMKSFFTIVIQQADKLDQYVGDQLSTNPNSFAAL